MGRVRGRVGLIGLVLVAGLGLAVVAPAQAVAPAGALAGRLIVLDPGHQLGNSNPRFADELSQTFFNGNSVKGCNTTGTATNAGFPEATFTWRVAQRLKSRLEAAGARVELTRTTNSYDDWGPCVWKRAQFANRLDADAMISIHADGAASSSYGFFAMVPAYIPGWTDDVVKADRRLARAMITGMEAAGATPANYISGALLVSRDTTTLNASNVPTVLMELGNMRNAREAGVMSTARGQQQYADWLYAGIQRYFAR